MTLTRFEAFNGSTYTFPATAMFPQDQAFTTNFKALLARSSRVPGGNGGIRDFGFQRAPSPVGSVQATIVLATESRSAMQALRDALNTMADWGMGKLVDTINGSERWAICSLQTIDMAEDRSKHTDLFQTVKLTFEAPEPYWITAGNQQLWDGTHNWNSAINWDQGSFTTITGSGTLSITPSGNAFTLGRFVARVTGSQNFNQLLVQRTVNGVIQDQIKLQLALNQNDVIEIDPRRQWALVNGSNQLANFDFLFPDWMRLLPGSNTLKVTLDDAAAVISATVFYYDRYY